ncbi:MAG: ABC transporter ATP-binding protein [Flexistipes sinusarabici]|uniref:ABC transporter ATP-binding protein n=1 Tax=Flexistipes sinusarabici TaxID=2352 RepID=A0A5D0MM14_FLESI|nr:ABC transporter ATP-binding protein [Flexistipes sinusarabici]TYB32985.1 MAG: ABC transporter ATP-binding protein [Flexistipes sinusarabici]
MKAVECDNIFKQFKYKGEKIQALSGLDLYIDEGEMYGFLGPNGAGKSTTIKILMDFIRADKGSTKIFGLDSKDVKSRARIGFLPENPVFMDNLTGREILRFAGKSHGMDSGEIDKKSKELLKRVELREAADRAVRKYSKGMIQRIGFAAAIIHDPELLVLDEPMSGLDPLGRVLFKDMLKELNESGTTIFFSSHIIPDIEDICTKIGIIKNGKMYNEIDDTELKYYSTESFRIIYRDEGVLPDEFKDDAVKISEELSSVNVSKSRLDLVLSKMKEENFDIVDIQPQKKDLEDLFVEISEK